MSLSTALPRRAIQRQPGWLARLFDYKPFLIVVCLLPAIGLLLVFLTYPLGLGVWLAFTDTTIGRARRVRRPRELPVAVGRSDLLARGVQHAALHGRRHAIGNSRSASGWRCC